MVKKKKIMLSIVLVSLALAAVFYFFESEERKIMKKLYLLGDRLSKESEEPAIIMAQRVRNIGSLFAQTCIVESDRHDLSRQYSSEEITSITASLRAQFTSLSLTFHDIRVEISGSDMARATMTGILKGLTKSEELFDETHELEMEFARVENDWLIKRMSAVEVLQK